MGYRQKKDIIFTELKDGNGVLLRLSDTFFFSINETGVFIWKALSNGLDQNDILNKIMEEFVEELKKENFIE